MTGRRGGVITQKVIRQNISINAMNRLQRSHRIYRMTLFVQRYGKQYYDNHPPVSQEAEESIP